MQESEIARQAVLTLPDSRYRQGLLDLMTLASQRLY
jgi:octaprenyl-diphosphate synthase